MPESKKRQGIWQYINNPFLVIGVLVLAAIPILIVLLSQRMKAEVRVAAQPSEPVCSNPKVSNEVFTKTYHLRDLTQGFGVVPTKDGGYLLSGDTTWSVGMAIPNPFVIKTNAQGSALWSRQFSSQSLALGMMSSRHIGRLAAETTDGNIVVAQDILDFTDAQYEISKEMYGDILVTKLDPKGNQLWSTLIGDWSIDRPQKIWATSDGGVLLLGKFMETGYGDAADTEAVPKYSVMAKIDKSGKVQWTKKMSWAAVDMQYLADGGFVALADINVPLPEEQKGKLGQETVLTDLPTIIRLDSNLNTMWAKSIESIPMEYNNLDVSSTGTTPGKTILRMTAGDFNSIQLTPDGGFIALGRYPVAAYQLTPGGSNSKGLLDPISYVAVKVDSQGNYKWAKSLKTPLGTYAIDFQAIKTTDNGFALMRDVIRDTEGQAAKSQDLANKQEIVTKKCKEFNCKKPGDENTIPEVKPYAEAATKAAQVMNEAMASNIEIIKTDANFNPRWIKKLDVERDLSGYNAQPTADGGLVMAARIITTKQHMVMSSLEPYEEAIMIKLDVNGNAGGCLVVSDHRQVSVEDVSQYIVMQDIAATAEDLKLNINKSVKPRVTTIKDVVRGICSYKKSLTMPTCSYLALGMVGGTGTSGSSTSTPVAKTWAQMNYATAKEGKLENDKSKQINDELMVILNKIFNNQVKMTDNMAGMLLDYFFPRLVTRADLEEVQKYYQGLGYKVDESQGGNLYVSRVGLTLHMDFYISNSMLGKLEVLY